MALFNVTVAGSRPEEVFTPRGEFNPRMYTPRPSLEADFARKLRMTSHLVLFGESGCGKSWLYRNFFASNGVTFKIVNLADASRNGRISTEILRVVLGTAPQLTGFDEKKYAQVGVPLVASGVLEHTKKYEVPAEDPLRHAIKEFRRQAGPGQAFIVFDNLERVFDKQDLMEELADLITLADDDEFQVHKIRFLLVGVPSGVKEYFNKTPSHRTIANRLVEMEEVSRLSAEETRNLVHSGFQKELQYDISPVGSTLFDHVDWVTDRIPQAVHEYCLELAFLGESNRRIDEPFLAEADRKWLRGSLNSAYSVVERQLNERDTKVQRRNQVLYALGRIVGDEFKVGQVEAKVRECFYPTEPMANVGGVPNALGELADLSRNDGAGAVLRRTPKGDAYMFLDPQYRMCIRAMLRKTLTNAVEKIPSDQV